MKEKSLERVKKREEEEESSHKNNSDKPRLSNYFSRLVLKIDDKKKEEEKVRLRNKERFKKIKNKYTGISIFNKLKKLSYSSGHENQGTKSTLFNDDIGSNDTKSHFSRK